MSTATLPGTASGQADPRLGELRDEIRHLCDLVLIRDLLSQRGAAAAELRECDAVITQARARLAASAVPVPARYTAAA